MDQLQQILNIQLSSQNQSTTQGQQSQSTPGTSLFTQKGTFMAALSGISEITKPWVIDFGATVNMTGYPNLFHSYKPSPRNLKIMITDGSLTTVAGTSTIDISPQISLKDVLHVPKLSCNLLSVSKIIKDLNCTALFSHSFCKFQDMTSRMRIGRLRNSMVSITSRKGSPIINKL